MSHLSSLEQKHVELDSQINDEQKSTFPDDIKIATLKRQKLKVKDQIMAERHRIGRSIKEVVERRRA